MRLGRAWAAGAGMALLMALGVSVAPSASASASASSGGGCGSKVNFYGSSGRMGLTACISFDGLTNFPFGGFVGDGYVDGAITQPCQFHTYYVTALGNDNSQWSSCYTGHLSPTESDLGASWAQYKICFVFSGVEQGCAISPKSYR